MLLRITGTADRTTVGTNIPTGFLAFAGATARTGALTTGGKSFFGEPGQS